MELSGLADCVAVSPAQAEIVAPLLRRALERARSVDGWRAPNALWSLVDELDRAACMSRSRREVVDEVVATTGKRLSVGILESMESGEVDVSEVSRRLRISRQAVLRRISRGTLPARRGARGRWLVRLENLEV